jgi:tetratricopeptide (TPR) repeat protein
MNKGNYYEALFLLNSAACLQSEPKDSSWFLKGLTFMSLNSPDSSTQYLLKIEPQSPLFIKSSLYASYNYAELGSYEKAASLISGMVLIDQEAIAIRDLQLAGISLLRDDPAMFEAYFEKADKTQPLVSVPSVNLLKAAEGVRTHRRKSAFLAGVLSGIVPGAGKLYAGKKGEALASFLATTGLGLVTWENYHKKGPENYMTIISGTLFIVSYSAGIYGSALSIRISETKFKEDVKRTVLLNLRISLDGAYRR